MTRPTFQLLADDALASAAERIVAGQLPVPLRERWQPLRMGLMNLFLFEDERFPFADGRLLLRGSNGAGKSRVLAMTLPLLLDGTFNANRVEPDRDPNRQVAWNLLMDDQTSRTGYSWLELGRIAGTAVESNGSPAEQQFLTIGCGMKAVLGQPIKPWFFATDLRVDDTLALQTPDGVPLTQRQLAEALTDRGQVLERAQDYRRLLDEKLFRLGDRYEPLLDLLLQLRQPKLAKKLELDELEAMLRGALPPLPEALLEDAANAFHDLEQYRTGLTAGRQMLADMKKFLRPYREHVQLGTRRAAKRLTQTNSEYETAQRRQRQALEDLDAGRQQSATEEELRRQLRTDLADAGAALEALRNRPEMQDAARLELLRASLKRQRTELAELVGDLERTGADELAADQSVRRAAAEIADAKAQATDAYHKALQVAAPDALVNRHRKLTEPLLIDPRPDAGQACPKRGLAHSGGASIPESVSGLESASPLFGQTPRSQLTADIERWRQAAAHLAARNQELAEAAAKLREASRDTERARSSEDHAAEELAAAQVRESQQREQLWEAIVRWWRVASPLQPHLPELGSFSELWHAGADALDADLLGPAIAAAERLAEQRFAAEESALAQQIEQHTAGDDQLAAEQHRLEAGAAIEPPVPYTRDPSVRRQQSAGAPLWQLVDFVAVVPAGERAHWEAALEAAGLLDAWLAPDGRLLDAAGHDTQLLVNDGPPLAPERQLGRVLCAADRCESLGVAAQLVEAVLAAVGVGAAAGPVWVDRDGRWQNGPLRGCWTKPQAQFIGDAARAQWRLVRLENIAAERAALAASLAAARSRQQQIHELRQQVAEHRRQAPAATTLLQRRADANAAQAELDRAARRHRDCQSVEQQQRDHVAERLRQREQDAADVGLPAWLERVAELQQRLWQYEQRLDVFWVRLDALAAAARRTEEARQRLLDVAGQRSVLEQRRELKRLELTKEEAQLREWEAASGQAVADIVRRVDAQRSLQEKLTGDLDACGERIVELGKQVAVLDSQLGQHAETSRQTDEARREAAEWFSTIGVHGLIALAVDDSELPDQPWSMTQALKVARSSDARLQGVPIDDDNWHRSQNRVHQEHNLLQQMVLSQDGLMTDVDHLRDGLQLVTVSMQGASLSLPDTIARWQADVADRERILDEKEQETLEKYLLGEVADGLRSRMKLAAELVDTMTREVSQRPMQTGMQLRFQWQRDPDGPPGLAAACDVLQTVAATWSPEERDQIKQFLQRRIRVERDSEHLGSWHDHLRAALDYRAWYRIEISRRSGPDADWRKLTRRTYGGGSGGEKSIALTLPQLAAAAAFYRTADRHAPRFILLDEAFAGVSADMREKCLELIVTFDLDVVMTSESEWGCYAGVPQLAICQLDRFAGVNAVVNRVYVWNGKQKVEAVVREWVAERERQPLLPD